MMNKNYLSCCQFLIKDTCNIVGVSEDITRVANPHLNANTFHIIPNKKTTLNTHVHRRMRICKNTSMANNIKFPCECVYRVI